MTNEQIALHAMLAATYEQKYGCKPTGTAVQCVPHAYELGCKMADRGYQDRQTGQKPLPLSTFEAAVKVINAGSTIAKLLHENYMIGYNGEKEVEPDEQ